MSGGLNLELIREPRLAGNYKFTLPLPGKEPWETIEANYVLGKDQPLSSFNLDGRTLTLLWQKPLKSRAGEKYDVAATMGIELDGEAVRFTLRIENNTPYQLGEVFFPVLGGVTGLGNKYQELKTTQFVRPSGNGAATASDVFSFSLIAPDWATKARSSSTPIPASCLNLGWNSTVPKAAAPSTSAPTTRPTAPRYCTLKCFRAMRRLPAGTATGRVPRNSTGCRSG